MQKSSSVIYTNPEWNSDHKEICHKVIARIVAGVKRNKEAPDQFRITGEECDCPDDCDASCKTVARVSLIGEGWFSVAYRVKISNWLSHFNYIVKVSGGRPGWRNASGEDRYNIDGARWWAEYCTRPENLSNPFLPKFWHAERFRQFGVIAVMPEYEPLEVGAPRSWIRYLHEIDEECPQHFEWLRGFKDETDRLGIELDLHNGNFRCSHEGFPVILDPWIYRPGSNGNPVT